jgi:hypothetical protein
MATRLQNPQGLYLSNHIHENLKPQLLSYDFHSLSSLHTDKEILHFFKISIPALGPRLRPRGHSDGFYTLRIFGKDYKTWRSTVHSFLYLTSKINFTFIPLFQKFRRRNQHLHRG